MSYSIWEESKDRAPTIWGADWDYFDTADYVIIPLDLSPCCVFEASVVTTSNIW